MPASLELLRRARSGQNLVDAGVPRGRGATTGRWRVASATAVRVIDGSVIDEVGAI
jgi:hypothetical protein